MLAELTGGRKQYGDFCLDCTMSLMEGRVTGLIGRNGAGKSTAFKSILGLIRTEGGSIQILGKDRAALTPEEKAQIGVVLSDSTFSGYLTVKQVCRIMKSMYRSFDQNSFFKQCQRMSIPDNKKIKDFSTGMKAKLKILLALSHDTRFLILDEPTAGLDVVARDQILDLLRGYMETEGRGILISSHISSDLEGLCDDIYMIHDGKILFHEDMDVLLDEYALLKVDDRTYRDLDRSYILFEKKESWGYSCLTNEKQFYMENYPGLVIEKGTVDEVISMVEKGEK